RRSREDERVDSLVAPEVLERLREERVRLPVVERDVRRRAEYDEHAVRVELPRVEDVRVRLEVGQVVVLLQTRVADELVADGAVAGEPLGRDRVGDDDLRRRSTAELVLEPS